MGVPYKGVVALFVGFSDLIPLVGATLGAIVAVGVAALHSLPAAIVVLVFFIVYQQAENHLLQPVIMSRTVGLNALAVLVSVLIEVELFGFLGALLAIPVAGVISVISRDLYDSYRGHPKPEPTIGEDQVPVSPPGCSRPLRPRPRPAGPPTAAVGPDPPHRTSSAGPMGRALATLEPGHRDTFVASTTTTRRRCCSSPATATTSIPPSVECSRPSTTSPTPP